MTDSQYAKSKQSQIQEYDVISGSLPTVVPRHSPSQCTPRGRNGIPLDPAYAKPKGAGNYIVPRLHGVASLTY